MSKENPNASETTRAVQRRQQILEAAADCFKKRGFHASGIAEIAKTAQMSVGQIYHYFENKEAIIAAIVERRLGRMLEIATQIENYRDDNGCSMIESILRFVACGVKAKMESDHIALWVEIMAEAARNPKVAEMVQNSDRIGNNRFLQLVEAACLEIAAQQGGPIDNIAGRSELISTLFEGISLRKICNPSLDQHTLVQAFEQTVRLILSPRS